MADKYVDFSAANDGDGTAYNQAASGGAAGAWNTIIGKSPTAGDKVWIRRQNKAHSGSHITTAFIAGVDYIGWPKSGDPYYAARPDGGAHAAWDGDSADYASFTISSSHQMTVGVAITSLHRFKVDKSGASSSGSAIAMQNGTTPVEVWNCYALCSGASTGIQRDAWSIGGRVFMYNCIGEGAQGSSSKSGTFYGSNFWFTNTSSHERSFLFKCISKGAESFQQGFELANGAGPNNSVFVDCEVQDNPARGFYCVGAMKNLRIIGGTINAQLGLNLTGTGVVFVQGLKFLNCDQYLIAGTGVVLFLHLREATQDSNVTRAMDFRNATFVMAWLDEGVTFHASNTDHISVNEGNTHFIMTKGLSEITNREVSSGQFLPGQWGSNFADTPGEFAIRNASVDVDGNADVTRDGGGPVSMKVASKVTYNIPGLDLWMNPFGMDTIYVPLVAGSQTLTLYGAHKGYTVAPSKIHVWFEFDYLDAGSGASQAWANTREDAALESDASGWTGETGETAFKVSKTVTVGQDCVARVRIGVGKYESGAYIYIDPKIVVS